MVQPGQLETAAPRLAPPATSRSRRKSSSRQHRRRWLSMPQAWHTPPTTAQTRTGTLAPPGSSPGDRDRPLGHVEARLRPSPAGQGCGLVWFMARKRMTELAMNTARAELTSSEANMGAINLCPQPHACGAGADQLAGQAADCR